MFLFNFVVNKPINGKKINQIELLKSRLEKIIFPKIKKICKYKAIKNIFFFYKKNYFIKLIWLYISNNLLFISVNVVYIFLIGSDKSCIKLIKVIIVHGTQIWVSCYYVFIWPVYYFYRLRYS